MMIPPDPDVTGTLPSASASGGGRRSVRKRFVLVVVIAFQMFAPSVECQSIESSTNANGTTSIGRGDLGSNLRKVSK
eukprot:scaffold76281_cov61-Attheya_sp.AAC.4